MWVQDPLGACITYQLKKKKRLASIPDLSLLSLIYRQFLRQD